MEADIEIGFRLADMLEFWPAEASSLVAAMQDVYSSVLARVNRLEEPERETFEPLLTELRRAMRLASPPPSD